MQLASKELAHWNRINAAAFPTTAAVEAHATRRARPGAQTQLVERARMEQALSDKAVMARALKQQAKQDQARLQRAVKAAAKPKQAGDKQAAPQEAVVKVHAAPKTQAQAKAKAPRAQLAAAPTQKTLSSEQAPAGGAPAPVQAGERNMDRLGDDVMDIPVHGPTDDGDVHVAADDVSGKKYMFKQRHGQKLFLGEGPWVHVPVEHEMAGDGVGENFDGARGVVVDSDPWTREAQMRVNPARPPCTYLCSDPDGCDGHPGLTDGDCDETLGRDMDIEGHSWPDDYPASYDAVSGNNHGLYKSNKVQQLRALPRQRLFFGEGPWAHVPVEHEMAGDGVGENFDGANGVVVDSNPWTKEAQLRVNGAQPPCMYRCASPSGWCEGHPGLAEGDCEEVLGFEHDIHHSPQHHAEYPATYDAWTGSPNGLFKAPGPRPSLRAMATAQFRAQEAADNEPAGLAALAKPAHAVVMGARRAPGLGSLAPTVGMERLKQLQLHQQMLEGGGHPWRASEMNATVRHAPHCVGGDGVGPCADTYLDMPHDFGGEKQSDAEVDADTIVPFMYKHTKGLGSPKSLSWHTPQRAFI